MAHSSQSDLSGAYSSASEAKSEGLEFKSLFKQIFALPLKLLIDYKYITLDYLGGSSPSLVDGWATTTS